MKAARTLRLADAKGRTALHWAIFGASYHTKATVLVAYEEIADALIRQGVEINRQDAYQDTALDYLLYSPSFEIQTLLIENGASSGFLAAFYNFFNQVSVCLPPTPDGGSGVVAQSRHGSGRDHVDPTGCSGLQRPFAHGRSAGGDGHVSDVQKRRAAGVQRWRPAGVAGDKD